MESNYSELFFFFCFVCVIYFVLNVRQDLVGGELYCIIILKWVCVYWVIG